MYSLGLDRLGKFILFFLRAPKLAKGPVSDGTAFKVCLDSEVNESSFVYEIFGSNFQQKNNESSFVYEIFGSNFQQKNSTFYFSNDF